MSNHLSDYKLKGKVKSVTKESKPEYILQTCGPSSTDIYEFNEAGLLTKREMINVGFGWNNSRYYLYKYDDDKLIEKTESYYKDSRDKKSRRTKIITYNSIGKLTEEKILDKDKIILERITNRYNTVGKISKSIKEFLYSEVCNFKLFNRFDPYNSEGLSLEEFEEKEKEIKKKEKFDIEISTYDKFGNKTKFNSFDSYGKLSLSENFRYNKKKKIIEYSKFKRKLYKKDKDEKTIIFYCYTEANKLNEKIESHYSDEMLLSKKIHKYSNSKNRKDIIESTTIIEYNKRGDLINETTERLL